MKFKYKIVGLDCPNCAMKLGKIMEKHDGVSSVKINFLTEKLTVESELSEEFLFELLSKSAKDFDSSVKIEK
jgi:Cd2+/Zn2+-exporting ATPase